MKIVIAILAVVSEVLCRTIGEGYPCTVGRQPSPPRYLRNVTQAARTEYFSIVSKRNETLAQQKQEILVWAQKYGIESQVQAYETDMANMQDEIRQNTTRLISTLSSVLDQYYSIINNDNQTLMEQKGALKNLSDQYPETYDVLLFAIDQYTPVRTGPGRGDSVAVEWGPKIPNSFTGFPSSPPPTAITPPPLPDGGAPRSPILQGRNKRDVPSRPVRLSCEFY